MQIANPSIKSSMQKFKNLKITFIATFTQDDFISKMLRFIGKFYKDFQKIFS